VKESIRKIDAHATKHNRHRRPFVWNRKRRLHSRKAATACKVIGHHPDNFSRKLSEEIVVSHASQKVLRFLLRLEPPSG
jgi:hypothetical protein